jgi:Zn-finger nucleic acid-binding protein
VPLNGIDYEGVHIETCPSCGGDWLSAGELGNIVRARKRRFNEAECVAIANATKIKGVRLPTVDRHLTCPSCGSTTHPVNYGDDSGIIVDECAACHGIWLDRGELEKIEDVVEGWRDDLPDDMKKYGAKMSLIASDEDKKLQVQISHVHLINSLINGIVDWVPGLR